MRKLEKARQIMEKSTEEKLLFKGLDEKFM